MALVLGSALVIVVVVLAIVTLRTTTVLTQIQRSMTADRLEVAESTYQHSMAGFERAMVAMGRAVERAQQGQLAQFERVVDMVAGPQQNANGSEGGAGEVDPTLENRAPWNPDDDLPYEVLDPTDYGDLGADDRAGMPGINDHRPMEGPVEFDGDMSHRAVSVRPGEGLVP